MVKSPRIHHHIAVPGRPHKKIIDWEIIADDLNKASWSLDWFSAMDSKERPIWIADAHRDGKRFIVRAK